MEGIIEEIVSRQKTAKDYILELLVLVVGIFLTATLFALSGVLPQAIPNILGSLLSTLCLVAIIAVWYGVYNIRLSQSIEFEYSFIDGSVDIDKIIAKKKRKRVVSFDIRDAELMAGIYNDNHNGVLKNTPRTVSVIDAAVHGRNDVWFVDVTDGGKRSLIMFCPSERMVEALWKNNPKAVVRDK